MQKCWAAYGCLCFARRRARTFRRHKFKFGDGVAPSGSGTLGGNGVS
jgi:hypothetical protein